MNFSDFVPGLGICFIHESAISLSVLGKWQGVYTAPFSIMGPHIGGVFYQRSTLGLGWVLGTCLNSWTAYYFLIHIIL